MMNIIQQFKQAMTHRLGRDTPQVVHGDGQIHTFMVRGKEWHYVLVVKKQEWEDEIEEYAAGYFGTLAGAGEDYHFATEGADRTIVGARKGLNGKKYNISLDERSETLWNKFIDQSRDELNEQFRTTWEKMAKHSDGQHRKHEEALYLPARDWEGGVFGIVRTFPDFRIIDGSNFSERNFVLLGELSDKPERVVIAHEWSDAEEIRKATGLPVLYVPTFGDAYWLLQDIEDEDRLPKETDVIAVNDPTRRSTAEWEASPDGIEPRDSFCWGEANVDHLRTLKQILNNQFREDDMAFDLLDAPELNYSLETGATIAANAEDISFIVPDFIPNQTLIEMHAPPGEGKTTLTLQALGAVAIGGAFLGSKVEKRPVVVCDYENAPSALKALIERIDGADQLRFLEDPPQLDQPEWVRMKMITSNLGNPVFLIDTLASACTSSDIGSNSDLAPVMRRLLELRNMGATILFLNHTLKRDASKFIGAQVIISQSDHIVSLMPNANGSYRFGTSGKTRYGHFEKTIKFDLDRKLFMPAGNPDQEAINSVLFALDLQSPSSVQQISTVTHVVEKKLRTLLDRYDGHHWKSERGPRNSKTYFPI